MFTKVTHDDWMGVTCVLAFLAGIYIHHFNPGLPRYGIHTLLARYYNLIALLTDTKGFVFAVLVYTLVQNALRVLLHFLEVLFAWVPSMRKQTSSANEASLELSSTNSTNSVLVSWIEEDDEEAWKQKMEDAGKREESESEEDSLDFLLRPADGNHTESRHSPGSHQQLYFLSI